jgi:hypothetical protein
MRSGHYFSHGTQLIFACPEKPRQTGDFDRGKSIISSQMAA